MMARIFKWVDLVLWNVCKCEDSLSVAHNGLGSLSEQKNPIRGCDIKLTALYGTRGHILQVMKLLSRVGPSV